MHKRLDGSCGSFLYHSTGLVLCWARNNFCCYFVIIMLFFFVGISSVPIKSVLLTEFHQYFARTMPSHGDVFFYQDNEPSENTPSPSFCDFDFDIRCSQLFNRR